MTPSARFAPAARRALLALALLVSACQSNVGRPAVSLSLERTRGSPGDAGVWIDEEFVGPLGFVAARGVRLPLGQHRISIQKEGYFPWDRLVVSDRQPIHLKVVLEPIPD